ncbi:SET domain-containing protein [Endozoicomonas sp.]|uniref:SET domain-containing protein n=1 Tax=Endozoicomonas sp. TaxID=1892382 RepID=UPI00383B5D08
MSSPAPASSPNIPLSPGQAPAGNKRLAVRLSTVTGCAGVGLFARKPSPGHNRPVFRRGETIMNVEGTLALRQTQANKKSLSWLVNQHYCHPLANDSRVIWSNIYHQTEDNLEVEFGSYPRCIAVCSNDSQKTEPNISFQVTNNLPETRSSKKAHKAVRKLDLDECPTYTVIALRNISDNEELLWSYSREGQDNTDYSGSYLKAYEKDKHQELITGITHNVINLEKLPVVVENSDAFDQLRISHYLGRGTDKPVCQKADFTRAEWKFCKPYYRNKRFKQCLTKAVETHQLPAFIKLQLHLKLRDGHELSRALGHLQRTFYVFKYKHLPLQPNWVKISTLAALYEYCVNHCILRPHQNVGAISYPWFRLKLEESPDDRDTLELLAKKISLKQEEPNAIPDLIVTNLCSHCIYNPLKQTAHWTVPDLEIFTEIATNRIYDPTRVDALIAKYNANTRRTSKDALRVNGLARAGDLKMMIAYIKKRFSSSRSCQVCTVATDFRKRGFQLWLDGKYVESSKVNMTRFIQENFTDPKDLDRMLRIEDRCTNEQLLDKIRHLKTRNKYNPNFEKAFLSRLHKMKHGDERILWSKEYIRAICIRNKIKYPSLALRHMKPTEVLQKKPSLYTVDDLRNLFDGENEPWFQRLFPNACLFSDDD